MVAMSVYPYLVAEAKLAPGTTSLVQQTATHMSKMLGGESVGGFPGFEPSDDDPKYQRKIKNRDFNGIDINDWVKEICNFLEQVIEKNPNLTLEQILQEMGLSATQIENFLNDLRTIDLLTKSYKGLGVTEQTVARLTLVMETLGVIPW
jgi:hypothetical protein